jgi:hypothetical protein
VSRGNDEACVAGHLISQLASSNGQKQPGEMKWSKQASKQANKRDIDGNIYAQKINKENQNEQSV